VYQVGINKGTILRCTAYQISIEVNSHHSFITGSYRLSHRQLHNKPISCGASGAYAPGPVEEEVIDKSEFLVWIRFSGCYGGGVAQVTVLWVLTLILHFGGTCFHHESIDITNQSCWLFLLIHTTMHGSMNIKFINAKQAIEIASCWLFLLIHAMMHGSINIKCFHHLQAEWIRFKQALKGSGRGNSLIMQGDGKNPPVRITDTAQRILCPANILATSLQCVLGPNSLQKWWQHPAPKILASTYDPTECRNLAVILTSNLPET